MLRDTQTKSKRGDRVISLLSASAREALAAERGRLLIERALRPRLSFAEFLEKYFLPRVVEVERPLKALSLKDIPHFQRWAKLLTENRFVALIAFRKAMKSVMARAVFAYDLYNFRSGIYDGFYYSASERLARRHIERLKMYIDPLAREWGWKDSTEGRALIRYEKSGALFLVEPEGIDSRQRGARANRLVIDDCIDPQKAITYADIDRAIEALSRRLLPLLKDTRARVLFVGTPICEGDVVEWVRNNPAFVVDWLPILNSRGESNWPERYSLEEIELERRLVGEKAFRAEYMLESVSPVNSFISPDVLTQAIAQI